MIDRLVDVPAVSSQGQTVVGYDRLALAPPPALGVALMAALAAG